MGKSLNYTELIRESVTDLLELERAQQVSIYRDRIRFIRYLKSGNYKSQKSSASAIGLKERQGQRIWSLYKKSGIKGLLSTIRHPGAPTKLSGAELEKLEERLKENDIQFLHEAVSYVEKEYGAKYSLSGIHYVFKRLKIKKKTGRPSNIRKDEKGLEDFKKTSNH